MPGSVEAHREGDNTQERRRDPRWTYPQGTTGTWVQAEGVKVGMNGRGIRWHNQASGPGRRDERHRMAGGRCGCRPG